MGRKKHKKKHKKVKTEKVRTLKSYHFSCGDSSKGPVGFCARIKAHSKKEALEKLKAALPEEEELEPYAEDDAVEYMNAYFNPDAITVDDIDEVDDVDEPITAQEDSDRAP